MKRFNTGDLAVTINSKAPLLNDGHIVRILRVVGPVPEWDMPFGYVVERIDGQPFAMYVAQPSREVRFGAPRTVADQSKLRPLGEGEANAVESEKAEAVMLQSV